MRGSFYSHLKHVIFGLDLRAGERAKALGHFLRPDRREEVVSGLRPERSEEVLSECAGSNVPGTKCPNTPGVRWE